MRESSNSKSANVHNVILFLKPKISKILNNNLRFHLAQLIEVKPYAEYKNF